MSGRARLRRVGVTHHANHGAEQELQGQTWTPWTKADCRCGLEHKGACRRWRPGSVIGGLMLVQWRPDNNWVLRCGCGVETVGVPPVLERRNDYLERRYGYSLCCRECARGQRLRFTSQPLTGRETAEQASPLASARLAGALAELERLHPKWARAVTDNVVGGLSLRKIRRRVSAEAIRLRRECGLRWLRERLLNSEGVLA